MLLQFQIHQYGYNHKLLLSYINIFILFCFIYFEVIIIVTIMVIHREAASLRASCGIFGGNFEERTVWSRILTFFSLM